MSGRPYPSHWEQHGHIKWVPKYVKKELGHRAFLGPFHLSPLGSRPAPMMTFLKKHSKEMRVIMELRHPKGANVNVGIR